jgi:hypothetical protein
MTDTFKEFKELIAYIVSVKQIQKDDVSIKPLNPKVPHCGPQIEHMLPSFCEQPKRPFIQSPVSPLLTKEKLSRT